jgi:primosomal protein N' (replication factor Y) (superfamily II helicase)
MPKLCDNSCMFIIECLPFSKGLNKESLSYFGPEYLKPGSLLKVNIRGKNVAALVLESRNAAQEKSQIKAANFQLKKISSFTSKPFLQKEFFEAVKQTSEYFAAPTGGILSHLIPSFILENPHILSVVKEEKIKEQKEENKIETTILQAEDEERFIHYRSLIREEFAKKKSVFVCLPQNEDIRRVKEQLERGIESYVCSFHSEMDKKDLKKEWKKVCLETHPLLIIATPRWLFLPRNDLDVIIIEKENKNGWKTLARPFIDLRFFAETLAHKKNIRVILGDSLLRTETLYRYKQGEIGEFENVKWRMPLEVKTVIADLRESTKKTKEFKTLSQELINLIKKTVEQNSHMFIFAARKGLSSVIVCRDCGEQVKCFNCSAPVVLYKTKSNNVFKCHQCGETRDATEICKNCHSWKLAAYGAGIDRISEEIRKDIPNVNLFEISKDVATTSAKATKIVENFYENKGAILLGTEMAFPYLYKKVANSAIASFDSLFSIPDFRVREKMFNIILQTKNLAKEKFIIQTRNPDDPTVIFAVQGNLMEFYKKETEDRQALGYPPFGIFIKIIARGTRNFVAKETENLKKIFEDYNVTVFNSVHEKKGEQAAVNAVIKLPRHFWPDLASSSDNKPSLLNILRSLPPHFEIKVDPDSLL